MKRLLVIFCVCVFFPAEAVSFGSRAASNPPPSPSSQTPIGGTLPSADRVFAGVGNEPTPHDLYILGRAVAARILSAYNPYTGNPELTRYLNLICRAILVHVPEIELYNGAYVLILDSPELNAFASPGGHIFLTRGLVQALPSEDMLAAVIAHEIAHIRLKHCANMISEISFYDDMAAIAGRAYEFAGNTAQARQLAGFRDSVSVMVDAMMISGYSRAQEYEADMEALTLLALSGYHPRALVDALEVLRRAQGSTRSGINATHPSPAERIANAERLMGGRQFRDTRPYRETRFRRM